MKVFLTVKNYRCFVQPATIGIEKGFTSFVGINNAGKSAIMRFLLEFRPLFERIAEPTNFLSTVILGDHQGGFSPIHVLDTQEVFSNLNENNIDFWLDFKYEKNEQKNFYPDKVIFHVFRNLQWNAEAFVNNTKIDGNNKHSQLSGVFLRLNGQVVLDSTIITSIFRKFSKTLYIGPFRNTINVGTNTNYLDIQIGEAFIKQFRALKTGNKKMESLAVSKLTEDITKIFEFTKLEINPSADDKTLHININNKPYMQHELGSGLMQFVIVLVNVLIHKPAYVLIDEPELNLHPKLQLDFLTTLGTYASEGIWFSTHSIGLARTASENVYSVLKVKDSDSIIKPINSIPRLAEFLGEMSFSSHKELGFEKILLVEGPTDVAVFQQFLRKLSKDHEVVILPLSGYINGKVTEQFEEIKRITSNLSVIIDSERTKKGESLASDRQAFIDVCKKMNINCHVLELRAIENYFSDILVKRVFGDSFSGLQPFQLLKEVQPSWGKPNNYKLAHEVSLEDLFKTDFGNFLKNL